MSQYKNLGKNVALMTVGNFSSKLLSFLFVPLYTSVLTTAEYGVADILSTTILLISPIFTMQISEAALRFALDKEINKKKVFTNGFIIILVGTLLFLIFLHFFSLFLNVGGLFWLFFAYYTSTVLQTFISQFTKGIDKVHVYALSGIINTVVVIISNLFFLLIVKTGVSGYICSFVCGNITATLFLAVCIKAQNFFLGIKQCDKILLKEMLLYSIPMIPNSLCWWITNSSDKYLITYLISASAVGIYSIAYKIPTLLSVISGIFMSAWHISAVEDFGSKKSEKFFEITYSNLSSLNSIVVSALILLSKPLAVFLYSKDFFIAWKIALILNVAFLYHALSNFLGSVYISSKKTTPLFYTTLLGAGVNTVANVLLIPLIGSAGAAIATLFSYFLVWIIRVYSVKTLLPFKICKSKNIIIGILLMIQVGISYFEISYWWLISALICIMITILHFDFLKQCWLLIFQMFMKLKMQRR